MKRNSIPSRLATAVIFPLLLLTTAVLPAAEVISLWPPGTPGIDPSIPEKAVAPSILQNIHNPTLTVYRPQKPNGCAVVICPSGAYAVLSAAKDGSEVAELLSSKGITGFVLKYRLPATLDVNYKDPVPLSDALRAIQWVRSHAAEFGINPSHIGIMGFSAGGHLAASAGTRYALAEKFGTDEVAKTPARPDFMALIYPAISTDKDIAHKCIEMNLLPAGASPDALAAQSVEKLVTAQTPPAFLAHAKDDLVVLPQNSVVMHEALQAKGVSSVLHLYEKGGHGFGVGRPGLDCKQWPEAFLAWLDASGLTTPSQKTP